MTLMNTSWGEDFDIIDSAPPYYLVRGSFSGHCCFDATLIKSDGDGYFDNIAEFMSEQIGKDFLKMIKD